MPSVTGFPATIPELTIALTLDKMGITYEFQTEFYGGRQVKGGQVSDFYLPYHALVISVLGIYYHYGLNRTAQDILQATQLNTMGITTIFIDEDDALKNPRYYIEEALKGVDHSKLGKG